MLMISSFMYFVTSLMTNCQVSSFLLVNIVYISKLLHALAIHKLQRKHKTFKLNYSSLFSLFFIDFLSNE